MGVRRAVETAWRESGQTGAVYTVGPLIHNPEVLEALKGQGVKILNDGEFPPPGGNPSVIIRAHGIPPETEAELARRGCRIIDATCPRVKASQMKARSFAEKGYKVFLAGEKNHGEITGIRGYAESTGGVSSCVVVGNPNEAEKAAEELFRRESGAKTVLIGQTTISPGEYSAIGEQLKKFFPNIEILETICGATADRQEALRELESRVDAVIVAGGRESSNTRRLLSLALELGKPAWLVEKPEELPPEIRRYNIVGLSAGASTPDSLIVEIENLIYRGK